MASGLLEARTSTQLVRNTVHEQYEGRALGFYMLNQLVPIVINVPLPGKQHKQAILVWGQSTQKFIPFSDLGKVSEECVKVFLFNVRHYTQCYLPNKDDGSQPYTFNLCKFCDVSVKDANKNLLKQIVTIDYRANMYIYQPTKALQNKAGTDNLFSYQEKGQSCHN